MGGIRGVNVPKPRGVCVKVSRFWTVAEAGNE